MNETIQKPKKKRVGLIILFVILALLAVLIAGGIVYNQVGWRFYMADTYTMNEGGSSTWRIPANDEGVLKLDDEVALTINSMGRGTLTIAGEEIPFKTSLDHKTGAKAKRYYFDTTFLNDMPLTIGFHDIFTGEHFEIDLDSVSEIQLEYSDDKRDRTWREFWIIIPDGDRELGTYLWNEELLNR